MANTLMSLLVSIVADTKDFVKGIGEADKAVEGFTRDVNGRLRDAKGRFVGAGDAAQDFGVKMKNIGSQMQTLGAAMTVGLTLPIVAFGAAAVKESMEAEAAIADLEATIKSTGGAAGVTSQAVQDYANKMQMLTKFSDDQIVSGNAMLLTFTNIGKDVFPMASDATLDMAQKFGMDLPAASITLGKALNDPIAGVGALRRIGVQLSADQEKQVKDFMAVNDVASAQKIILNELSKEIGGVAQAYGQTSGGQMAIFNNQLGQLKEALGAVIIPVLIDFMKAITPVIVALTNAPEPVQRLVVGFAAFIAVLGPVIGFLGTLMTGIAAITPVLTSLMTFITATAVPGLAVFGASVGAAILPLLLIIGTLALVYYAFKTNFGGIATTAQQLWFLLGYVMNNIVNSINNVIQSVKNMAASFLGIKAPNISTGGVTSKKALGGSVLGGVAYTVGEHGQETFVPDTNGQIIPNGQKAGGAGNNITINVTNPKREATEDSIRKAMKNLSYLGVAS